MLRLFGLLVTLIVFIGAVLAIDFNSARSGAAAKEQPVPDFDTYLSGLRPRLIAMLSSARVVDEVPALSTDLAQMLPRAPEGWAVRPAESDDLTDLFPKTKGKIEADVERYVEKISSSKAPKGGTGAALTFEKDARKVIIKAIRHSDQSFTDPLAFGALLAEKPAFFQRDFLRVRGLDVFESTLPGEMRARLFTADVGSQIRIWFLVSKRLSDKDLLPFFETLDVRAMNASVIDQEAGLGEVPVMLLVSDLDEDARAAYEADRAEKAAERERRRAEARDALAAAAPVLVDSIEDAGSAEVTCSEVTGGIKRCKVGG